MIISYVSAALLLPFAILFWIGVWKDYKQYLEEQKHEK